MNVLQTHVQLNGNITDWVLSTYLSSAVTVDMLPMPFPEINESAW